MVTIGLVQTKILADHPVQSEPIQSASVAVPLILDRLNIYLLFQTVFVVAKILVFVGIKATARYATIVARGF